ncbi:MAG TPA: hypothetical protein VK519_12235 [Pinirhizobacter sp.]|uniref:hypothetical protein n=1 Tax=Pinirhizobacter sp. TaxID=2950432 RepID=UPI002B877A59|nr:hypothetical protein [Pinirhizobacter sp.]HMH68674.1 hypothetical protein [Pinirhizobacter sp.]
MNRWLMATLAAGTVAAIVEIVPALPIQQSFGVTPIQVFQSIASGIEGRPAFEGGMGSAVFGAVLHWAISLVFAGVWVAAAQRSATLSRHFVPWGIVYGLVAYVVMNWIVLPLSAAPFQTTHVPWRMAMSISFHLFLFGLPIAAVAHWVLGRLRG